jgi:hypothetical protein
MITLIVGFRLGKVRFRVQAGGLHPLQAVSLEFSEAS